MEKGEKRYSALKAYMESGNVQSLDELFQIVPKSVFVRDSGINYVRLTTKINNPEKFTVKDIIVLSDLIGIDSRKLFDLIIKARPPKLTQRKSG